MDKKQILMATVVNGGKQQKVELTMLEGAKVAEGITNFVGKQAATATELHELMIQAALHAYFTGDTVFIKRLCLELQNNPDEKLKGAAITNVAGMKYWFSCFIPCNISADGSKVKLLDKDGEAYAKFIENGTQFGDPDAQQQMSGNRAFWLVAGSLRPFWDMAGVKEQQRTTIRPLGMKAIVGNVFKLDTQLNKAIEDGTIPKDSVDKARELVNGLMDYARKFRDDHAADILREEEQLAALRNSQVETEKVDANATLSEATDQKTVEAVGAKVGGDVEAGLKPNEQPEAEVEEPKTGTDD
jgi:hypothetical protein